MKTVNTRSPDYRRFAFGDKDSVTRLWLDRGAAGWCMDVAPWVSDDFWRAWRKVVKQQKPDAMTGKTVQVTGNSMTLTVPALFGRVLIAK